jgi:hypothetical protein
LTVQDELDFSLTLAWWLAWATLLLLLLIIMGLLILRWVRWRNEPRMAAFHAYWRPMLMRWAMGDKVYDPLPVLKAQERWPFMKLWLHSQMSLQGSGRQRLAELGLRMGCREMALARIDSTHYSERMVGVLALGFLQDRSSVPTLKERLASGNGQSMIYAARALMEIDQVEHGAAVVHALLTFEDLDFALVSVLLKPFKTRLEAVLMPACPGPQGANGAASHAQAFQWLRLAQALKLLVPQWRLTPFLSSEQHIEILIAALRLVQGEQGTEVVACHAKHPDWRVRVQVARALGRIGGLMHQPVLLGLLTDGQWWVRYRSAQALWQMPGMRHDPLLAKVLATNDRYALSMLHAVRSEK